MCKRACRQKWMVRCRRRQDFGYLGGGVWYHGRGMTSQLAPYLPTSMRIIPQRPDPYPPTRGNIFTFTFSALTTPTYTRIPTEYLEFTLQHHCAHSCIAHVGRLTCRVLGLLCFGSDVVWDFWLGRRTFGSDVGLLRFGSDVGLLARTRNFCVLAQTWDFLAQTCMWALSDPDV